MPWLTQSMRVSVFPPPGRAVELKAPTFKELIGQEPEQTARRGGAFAQAGAQLGHLTQVSRQLNLRADLAFAPNEAAEESLLSGKVGSLGEPAAFAMTVRDVVHRFVTGSTPIARMAVGMIAIWPTGSREQSYESIKQALRRQQLDLTDVQDFIIQLNRRTRSKALEDMEINQLGKWAGVQTTVELRDTAGFSSRSDAEYGMRVEADINTVAERTELLPADRVTNLVDELTAFGIKLITEGEQRS